MASGLLSPPVHARSDTVIWEGDDQAVLLAPQDGEAAPPNDHPVTIAPQVIEVMLAGLRLRYSDQEPDTPPVSVFNEDQVAILGKALSEGLASAGPSQDVTFSIIGAHRLSPGAFARRNRLTAGRVFFHEGKLNVIFGEIQSPYRKKNIYGRIDEDFYPRRYGGREAGEDHEAVLVASTAASLHSTPEGPRSDWVAFDPEPARADEARGIHRPLQAVPPARAAQPTPPPAEKPGSVSAGSSPQSMQHADAGGGGAVENRLETLKRLREKNLISEEAYRKRVDEILKEL
jgi:hypothetical protein